MQILAKNQTGMIIMCSLPFRLVESEGFIIFMDFMTNGKWEKLSKSISNEKVVYKKIK